MLTIDKDYLKNLVRTVPDWPSPGIMFRDITPLFQHPKGLRSMMDAFVNRYFDMRAEVIAGLDARGFMLGVTIAYELNIGFVPIRKKGKLPWKSISEDYDLEYGKATVEVHEDAIEKGQRVVLFDDLIATGGTMLAGARLLRRLGGEILEAAAIVDLPELGGSARIREAGIPVHHLIDFAGH
ncbi:MAG: adenine phosphoribosyltransferase [Leptospirales bacterium]|nr:adenine phosphoribosyltransferase [Leptospirales bacterium]